jgi:iron-sulfur cluster assembly protein
MNLLVGCDVKCLKSGGYLSLAPIKQNIMPETLISSPVSLTAGALEQLLRIRSDQGVPDHYGLRVGVKGGGCSGFSYLLGFDEPKDQDTVYEFEGVKILMDKAHALYLLGMEVDWLEGLNNRGFVFNNPNAKETCGCGTSFSA